MEEVELEGREVDPLLAAAHLVALDVDHEVADLEEPGRRGGRGAQARADAGDELLGVEGLDDVVVGAGLEALDDVGRVGLRREHDDGDAGLGADEVAHLDAVEAREHEVEEHQVGLRVVERGERLAAVPAEGGLEALGAQDDADHLGERGVVVDHQDPCCHLKVFPAS